MTEEEEEEYQRQMNVDDQNLVNVDGTKLKLSVKLIKVADLSEGYLSSNFPTWFITEISISFTES